jgi:hypothetical protein
VGVCLFEIFTGHVMFPGRSNNEMLKLMMEVKGKVPNKVPPSLSPRADLSAFPFPPCR